MEHLLTLLAQCCQLNAMGDYDLFFNKIETSLFVVPLEHEVVCLKREHLNILEC